MSYACPCCGYLTFDDLPYGSFEICGFVAQTCL
ncbi:CPCC family cysteine-rich protein [Acinetobacter baumannii]